jgi:3-dehydroquinate synthase
MDYLQQSFSVRFDYKVVFTEHLFNSTNPALKEFFNSQRTDTIKKIFFVVDEGVSHHHPLLEKNIKEYFSNLAGYTLIPQVLKIEGGENAKNNSENFYRLVKAVDEFGIDRHSYIAAVGGGSILDLVGYAAAVSHRGIRHIRIPTTVLSQNDSGVGVKNGINYSSKKNFLGTFVPPVAVFNDFHFLTTLSDAEWRSGISEAIKVALIKDKTFFSWLQENARALASRNMDAMKHLIRQCAAMHIEHIASGDPFEMGSSRPLDFGHWSAHKVEQLSDFSIRHGEAVALGIALDSTYSYLAGRLSESELKSIIQLMKTIGFSITHPLMEIKNEKSAILNGLNEFREHLGGKLTIMLLDSIGKGVEVHELDNQLLIKAGEWLKASS